MIISRKFMLRDYQEDIKQRVLKAWLCHNSVMVQMPTGTGKTHLLASLVDEKRRAKARGGEPACVWIVAHRRELVEQIEETVAKYGIRKGEGTVRALSIQWLSRHWEDMQAVPGLIVIDEAHHALAETYKELWTRYPEAKKLGMTATPCRLNGKGFTDLFDVLVTSDGILDFIKQGWLSVFDYVSIKPNSLEQRLIAGLVKRGADGDYQIKEMNTVLNRQPRIERLYASVCRYAEGKKGIVYAISIDHARNIASYYTDKGIKAVAIDSKTSPGQRKQWVEDFREGKIRVLVNVDVFSEGFDCPDVEFVQLARPTLSLSKYLQQVGRGLRRSAGKDGCILIDNVGLYRVFGLPIVHRDWQAMFEGRLAGKGCVNTPAIPYRCAMSVERDVEVTPLDSDLEWVMTHDKLLDDRATEQHITEGRCALKAFKDRSGGLYGLKRGDTITVMPQYPMVWDTEDDRAAVCLTDGQGALVSETGEVQMRTDRCRKMKFLKDQILAVTDEDGKESYVDLRNQKVYPRKPKVLQFGRVQMLEVNDIAYSRTKHVYSTRLNTSYPNLIEHGYALRLYGFRPSFPGRRMDGSDAMWSDYGYICLFADDYDTYYHFTCLLPDGSMVIEDDQGHYYHVEDGKEKRYIACRQPLTTEEAIDQVIPRLQAEAMVRIQRKRQALQQEQDRKRLDRLASIQDAVPFKAGLKWGLKQGERVLIPPIYRNVLPPIGRYCAFEDSPHQWGILMLDGKVVVEARYTKVEIKEDGTAYLTLYPGKMKTVKLGY